MRFVKPRIYIEPGNTELILELGRIHGTVFALDGSDVVLVIKRRTRKTMTEVRWLAYEVDQEGFAHFEIPEEFLIDTPSGFYDTQLVVERTTTKTVGNCFTTDKKEKCLISEIAIIKATGMFVKRAYTANNMCEKTKWLEPLCDTERKPCVGCGEKKCTGDCPPSLRHTITKKVKINANYAGLYYGN